MKKNVFVEYPSVISGEVPIVKRSGFSRSIPDCATVLKNITQYMLVSTKVIKLVPNMIKATRDFRPRFLELISEQGSVKANMIHSTVGRMRISRISL